MKRTTLDLDERLLERAKRALGKTTTRATVEEALRMAAEAAETDLKEAATTQRRFFESLATHADVRVLSSKEMWK